MTKPIVSICCITYNHASFIRKALDGFLMQKPPTGVAANEPWFEILIHDDASTDGTTEIIKEYAEKFPDKIFPLYEEENQYPKIGVARLDLMNFKRAKGKYIAYCEGDDYWTDSKKLQKQITFMDAHPEYSVCFHGNSIYDERKGEISPSRDFEKYKTSKNRDEKGTDITITDFFDGYYGLPLTMLFRVAMYDFDWYKQYKYYRDTHETYHLLRAGKGYWMNFNGAVYVQHNGGISTSVDTDQRCLEEREHVMELYLHNRNDKELQAHLVKILLWNHDVYKREGRVREFYSILRSYWKNAPMILLSVYGTICKRYVKERLMCKV